MAEQFEFVFQTQQPLLDMHCVKRDLGPKNIGIFSTAL